MLALSPRERHWSVPGVFVKLWRRWIAVWADQLLEAARLGAGDVEYLTHDAGFGASGLCTLAGDRADNHDLLRRRMIALELDPYELALSDPALLRHLQSCCTLCESREHCVSDLARASTDHAWQGRQDWRDYCENALTLEMLGALRSRSKAVPKYQFPYFG